MITKLRFLAVIALLPATLTFAQAAKQQTKMTHATGTFDVKITPAPADDKNAAIGRMSIAKQWHGDMQGTSQGEMLTAQTDVKGSGVYVALEQFTGTVGGRKGSFLMHHTGIMTRGEPHLAISIVPDSGSGELRGITGTLDIVITEGKHSYDLTYTIADGP